MWCWSRGRSPLLDQLRRVTRSWPHARCALCHYVYPEHTYEVAPGPPLVVALVSSEHRAPLNVHVARLGAQLVASSSPTSLLHQLGILDDDGLLQLSSLQAAFKDRPILTLISHLNRRTLPTCWTTASAASALAYPRPYALYGQCEHAVFVDSLHIATRAARVDLDRLPAACARKGRKAAKRASASTTAQTSQKAGLRQTFVSDSRHVLPGASPLMKRCVSPLHQLNQVQCCLNV